MSAKSNLIAMTLAVFCVTAMAISIRQGGQFVAGASRQRVLITAEQLPVDDLTLITLRRGEEAPLTFERRGAEWWQIDPFEFPMDPFSIRQLAVLARELEVSSTVSLDELGGSSLETLSLEPPAASIKYQWPSGSLTLDLGRRSVAGRAYLRRVGDEAVYIVGNKLHDRAIDMDVREWRDRTLFRHVGVDADRIAWDIGEHSVAIERDRRQWRMVEPVRTRVDPINRDVFMQDLGRAQAAGFILDQPDDLSRFGLANPVLTLTITASARSQASLGATTAPATAPDSTATAPTSGVRQRLVVGNRVGASTQDRFGMIEGRPVVMRLTAASIAAIFRQARDLADPTASGVVPADVKSIVIRSGSNELQLERDLDRWKSPSSGGAAVNAADVQELLEQLTQLRAPQVDIKPYPREYETATITLHGFDGRAMDTVRIAREPESGRWALENGDGVLRVFPPGLTIKTTAADFGL